MAIINTLFWKPENPDDLVYKFTPEYGDSFEITTSSVLIVADSQQAYLYKDGSLCDSFKSGRHILSTENIPVLRHLLKLPSGGKTTYHAEVWFVSLLERRNMFWGIGDLRIFDSYFDIPIKIFARGGYGIQITDGALFMQKLVGTKSYVNTSIVETQFRSLIKETVKVQISSYMRSTNSNINDVCSDYTMISSYIAKELHRNLSLYGVSLLNFNIEDINIDESDPNYLKVMDAVAESARLKKLGVNYVQNRQIDIAQAVASNEGAGNFIGVGMGLGVGQTMGTVLTNSIQTSGLGQASPPPPPPSAVSFFVAENGATIGPFTIPELGNMVATGRLISTSFVFRMGGSVWEKAAQVDELSILFPPAPPTI